MNAKKKLMILGAGIFQLSGIKKATELGHYIITVDNIPGNLGHSYSDQQLNICTTDKDAVLNAAKELSIDGICTFSSDVAIPTIGYVSEKMGFPGLNIKTSETLSNKYKFRDFLCKFKLTHPKYAYGRYVSDIESFVFDSIKPLIIKPVDASGSKGVFKIFLPTLNELNEAFNQAIFFSRSDLVIVEEFLDGIEVGGDGLLTDGILRFVAITQKHLENFVVTGHSFPSNINTDDQIHVISCLEHCCNLLGYDNGPINFDVMVMPEQVVILEISPRNGGNGIPDIIKMSTGFDIEKATIDASLGNKVEIMDHFYFADKCCGSMVFGSKREGILVHINNFEAVKEVVPELVALNMAIQPKSFVKSFQHNGNLIGYALFEYNEPEQYRYIVERIRKALNIWVA